MKTSSACLPHLIGPSLLNRFVPLQAIPGFRRLATASEEKIESGEWRIDAASGLRGIYLRFDGGMIVEIACTYRDQVEEFTFVTNEIKDEEVASTLVCFFELLLALPAGALAEKNRIRDILAYHKCKAIY